MTTTVRLNLTIEQSQELGLLIGERLLRIREDECGDIQSEEYRLLSQIAGRMGTATKRYRSTQ